MVGGVEWSPIDYGEGVVVDCPRRNGKRPQSISLGWLVLDEYLYYMDIGEGYDGGSCWVIAVVCLNI